jgi:hypothetical protein
MALQIRFASMLLQLDGASSLHKEMAPVRPQTEEE